MWELIHRPLKANRQWSGLESAGGNNSFVYNCGINVDCGFGGPPSIFGAYAGGFGTSLGYKAFTGSGEASAIGPKSEADGLASFAWGDGAKSFAGNETVIGDAVYARNNSNIIMGGGGGIEHDAVLCLYCFGAVSTYNNDLSTATNQALLGLVSDGSTFGLLHWYFGMGVTNSTTSDIDFNIAGAKGTDTNGANWIINGSRATGAGKPGNLIFATSTTSPSGSDLQALTNRLRIDGSGNIDAINGSSFRAVGGCYGSVPSSSNAADISMCRGAANVLKLTNGLTGPATISSPANTPTEITSDQNNYSPGTGWLIRVTGDFQHNITGMVAGQDGETRHLVNVGTTNLVLVNESISSLTTNRFRNSTGTDIVLSPDQEALLIYDSTSNRWRVFATSVAATNVTLGRTVTITPNRIVNSSENAALQKIVRDQQTLILNQLQQIQGLMQLVCADHPESDLCQK